MTEASPRQVLYALVAGGFVAVVLALVIGAAAAGLAPTWWTVTMGIVLVMSGAWMGVNWRRTALVLSTSILLFLAWMIGTLIVV